MENYKIRNALYVGDTVYTIGETIKINSRIVNSSDMYQPQNERLLFPFV